MKNNEESLDKVLSVIKCLKELDQNIERIALNGGCYRFHLLLREIFCDAVPYINVERNHVITKIGQNFYDITGVIPNGIVKKNYHEMTTHEVKAASKWKYKRYGQQ